MKVPDCGAEPCEGWRDAAAEIATLQVAVNRLTAALEFYANPDSYVGVAVLADPPAGEFADDFSEVETEWGTEVRPGKRARQALESGDGPMTTVTVALPFELTREHMLVLKAAERELPVGPLWKSAEPLELNGVITWALREDEPSLTPLGRAILDQCPLLWDEAELEAKLREMAG